MFDVTFAVAVNDRVVLDQCLRRSPDLEGDRYPLIECEGYASASAALNHALDNSSSRYIVFVHQDVYIPAGWIDKLAENIAALADRGTDWAMLGIFGLDREGTEIGQVWSTDVMKEYGSACDGPQSAVSLDECLLVLDRTSGLRFDPNLPHFHLYAADMILQGHEIGRESFAICAPVVHHSVPVKTLRGGYALAYRYMQRKWRRKLPWPTLIVPLTTSGWALLRGELRRTSARLSRRFGKRQTAVSNSRGDLDPMRLAQLAGYEAPRNPAT